MNGQILQSGKGTNLLLNGYLYRRDKRFAAKQHWRCTVRGCGARVHADYADPPIILKETGHSHPPDNDIGVNRPAFGGTVPHFHQMSRVPRNETDVPHF